MWDYTDTVKEHFFHPRNVGEVQEPDGVGEVGSLACGDALRLTFKLDDNGRITEAKFRTFGCGSAIASSSALTEMIKGKTLDEALKVTNRDIADYLGGLPEQKMHCSVMGREALEAAIENYRSGTRGAPRQLSGKVICTCYGVTEEEIRRVVQENNLSSVEQVTNYCKAGGGCGGCHPDIRRIIDEVRGQEPPNGRPEKPPMPPKGRSLTNIQRMQAIQQALDQQVRPALQADGGDIELIDIDGEKVIVALRGTCSQCKVADFTLADVVEAKLREFVDDRIIVEERKT
jgi:NifU-like protein